MKILRITGLLVMLLAVAGAIVNDARASDPITCWRHCDDVFYSGECTASLERCCRLNQDCPLPMVFVDGDCTDGQNYCP